jgi:hypothetical protein
MTDQFLIALVVVFIIAGYIQAYQWGWHNGHDIHHDDEEHGPNTTRKPDKSFWV